MSTTIVLTPEILIAAAKVQAAQDAARMAERPAGMPRCAWRNENPIDLARFTVKDTAFKTRPLRTIQFDLSGNIYDAWVWGRCKLIETIDLRAADAASRLARYHYETPANG